jgi:hypothetical protein
MSGLLRNLFNLAALVLLTMVVTAVAADLASQRPSLSQLGAETRSRLVADYSADRLAQLLEPLSPEIIRAAAEDEAALGEGPEAKEAELLPTPTPSAVVPVESPTASAGATPAPTASPGSTTPSPGTSTPEPSSTPGPSSTPAPPTAVPPTATRMPPTPTYTPPPTFTPTPPPTSTPPPTATPSPTSTPRPTSTPPPTATPKPAATPDLCELLPDPPPVCDK